MQTCRENHEVMLHLNPIQQGQNKLIKMDRIDFYIASKNKISFNFNFIFIEES